MRKAKIVATIGPSSSSREKLEELVQAGMDVARLNFSHGTHEIYSRIIADLRDISSKLAIPIAILQDLAGLKVRTGSLVDHAPVTLVAGQNLTITTDLVEGTQEVISVNYKNLPQEINVGETILLSDGLIDLKILDRTKKTLTCTVLSGGELTEHQGINMPGSTINAPPLTPKDLKDLLFGIEQEVDFVALSFVRSAGDMIALREILQGKKADIPIIAKLEKPSAISDLEAILANAEGVMVARGDLGVEVPPERVPVIQKHVISQANQAGKLVITATQMLDSMIRQPRPTRAEASDVANTVIDGTDALMLSGETAIGKFPVESVAMMDRIITEAESLEIKNVFQGTESAKESTFPGAACHSAYHASRAIDARFIIVFTQSGATALKISKYRPSTEILAFTPQLTTMNRVQLYWGVNAILMHPINKMDELIEETEKLLLKKNLAIPGDNLIILTGVPILERGHTSLMKLHKVSSSHSPS
jgi:pyruvate kinase